MQALSPDVRIPEVLEKLSNAPQRRLLLDFDGTLAPFVPERLQAKPYPGLPEILNEIEQDPSTRIVLISGRPCEEIAQLLGTAVQPEIWGSHGAECLLPNGIHRFAAMDEVGLRSLADLDIQLAAHGLEPRLEHKPGSTAVHWRGLTGTEQESIRSSALQAWHSGPKSALELRSFDGGLEFRVRGPHKGTAVSSILRDTPDDTFVAYLGDDDTDEDAFRALHGRGLRVLVRAELRPTLADVWLRPPQELFDFLHYWTTAKGSAA